MTYLLNLKDHYEDYWYHFKPASQITNEPRLKSNNQMIYTFELLGCPKDAIKIEIENAFLKVSAEFDLFGSKKSYSKYADLGFEPDYDNIKCEYQEGVLKITVPRKVSKKEIKL